MRDLWHKTFSPSSYSLFFICCRLSLLSIASSVFLGLCVYNDARAHCNSNAVMWGVLSGFFWIAAVVYLCMRSSAKSVSCLRCYQIYPSTFPACPTCGLPSPNAYRIGTPQQQEQWKKRCRLFLILYIVATVLTTILSIVVFVWYMRSMLHIMDTLPYYSYH